MQVLPEPHERFPLLREQKGALGKYVNAKDLRQDWDSEEKEEKEPVKQSHDSRTPFPGTRLVRSQM